MSSLRLHHDLRRPGSTLVMAFSGWMDGGDVSTGTVERLVDLLDAQPVASIEADSFYIFNFPGSMEIASMFRPEITITDGHVSAVDMPTNHFYLPTGQVNTDTNTGGEKTTGNSENSENSSDAGEASQRSEDSSSEAPLFFVGHEPNLRWEAFADSILEFAARVGVTRLLFVGSFGGSVPHTREPRLYLTATDDHLLREFDEYASRRSDYTGPSSFTSYLMTRAPEAGMSMVSLVAEIPGYLQGTNPLCIEAVTRRLAKIFNLQLNLAELRVASDEWEAQVTQVVAQDEDLSEKVRELEEQYDNELIGQATPAGEDLPSADDSVDLD